LHDQIREQQRKSERQRLEHHISIQRQFKKLANDIERTRR